MRFLVTGATGFLGRPLCERLRDRGHDVVVVSRNASRAGHSLPFAKVHTWQPQAGPPPTAALDGCDGIVNLMGESVQGRWNAQKMTAIRNSRVLGTQNLVAGLAAMSSPPKVLVSASAIGFYGDRGDETLNEDSPAGPQRFGSVCTDWEAAAMQARELGVRVAVVRTGIALDPAGGALQRMLLPARLGLGGPLGSGRQWWSWIHREDVVGIYLFALESSASGALAGSSPQPVRQKDFARTLGRVLRRPAFLPVPAFVLKLLLGEFSFELLSSKRIAPKRLLDQGYRFRHPDLEPALRDLLA
jgi:uncharacterized protein (TIGR01777 family)